ncbi:MAG: CDP-alcohol phosphatidyltransferase family protein [Ilumatobacteraceae bacterium]
MTEAKPQNILTFPNLITAVRLACLPIFLWLLFGREDHAQAAFLLGVLGITDWVDGWIARRFNQSSDFGAIFDPATDRVLFIVGTGAVLISGAIPLWFGLAIVIRESLVSAVMVLATLFGMRRFEVSLLGKRYTFLLMMAVPLLLLGSSDHVTASLAEVTGWVLGVPGLVLCYYTAFAYIPKVRENLAVGRGQRNLAKDS